MDTDLVWTCPRCGRSVPRRLYSCRCGYTQVTAASVDASVGTTPETSVPPPSAGISAGLLTIVGGIAIAAVTAATGLWFRPQVATQEPAVVAGFGLSRSVSRRPDDQESTLPAGAQRQEPLERFERDAAALAARLDAVDRTWEKFAPECYGVQRTLPTREWFVLWDGRMTGVKTDRRCRAWATYFAEWARRAHDAIERYESNARHAGVAMTATRGIRQKYRLNWPEWQF